MSRTARMTAAVAVLTTTSLLAGCGGSDRGAAVATTCEEGVTLELGHVWPESDPQAKAVAQFAKQVAAGTDGAVGVKSFPAGQLGEDGDILEGLTLGTADMWVGGAGVYSAMSDVGQFFVTPFMFDSVNEAAEAYNAELGKAVSKRLENETDTQVVGFWPRGPRHITGHKALETPADLQGLKIRVPENPMFIESFKALGANPTPMDFTEVFTSLQQGVIDSQENPLALIDSSGFAKVQSHLNLTGHVIEPLAISMSDDAWSSLCEKQQAVVVAAAESVGQDFQEQVNREESQLVDKLEADGMRVVEPDIEAYREKIASVRETVGADFADLYAIVENQ